MQQISGDAWLQCAECANQRWALSRVHPRWKLCNDSLLQSPRRHFRAFRVRSQHTTAAKRVGPPDSQIGADLLIPRRPEHIQSGAITPVARRPTAQPSNSASLAAAGPSAPPRDPERERSASRSQQPVPQFDRGRGQQRPRPETPSARVIAGPTQRQILDRILLGGPLEAVEPLLALAAPSRLNFSLQERGPALRPALPCHLGHQEEAHGAQVLWPPQVLVASRRTALTAAGPAGVGTQAAAASSTGALRLDAESVAGLRAHLPGTAQGAAPLHNTLIA